MPFDSGKLFNGLKFNSGGTKEKQAQDPRQGCCWRGKAFFNAIKAMISRVLYLLHALLIVWRVTVVLGHYFWCFNLPMIGILLEAIVVIVKREGKEWTWFQPTILFYLLTTIPSIWLLEMEKVSTVQIKNNSSSILLGGLMDQSGSNIINFGSVAISNDFWTLLLEQSMLVLIIICRWLMPKGALTREQLSGLLLYYLGTASDIVDFFSVLAEDEVLLLNLTFFFTIISVWSWSMFQFIFVSTMTSEIKDTEHDDSDFEDDDEEEPGIDLEYGLYDKPKPKKKKGRLWKKIKNSIQTFIESEAWTITTSIFMQDGPFAIVRLICLFYWNIRTYTNYFFTLKNILVLMLQVYRLQAVYEQHKQTRLEELKKHKQVINRWAMVGKRANILMALTAGKNPSKKISTTSMSAGSDDNSRKISTSSVQPEVKKVSSSSSISTRECDTLASYIKDRRVGIDHTRDIEEKLPSVI